jgi:hypothetical protein
MRVIRGLSSDKLSFPLCRPAAVPGVFVGFRQETALPVLRERRGPLNLWFITHAYASTIESNASRHAMSKVPQGGRSGTEQSKHPYWSGKFALIVAGGVAASLALAIGVVWFVRAGSGTGPEAMTVTTVRPVETIRYAPAPEQKTASGTPTVSPNVQPPQGTIRRMEAISGTFKK